jgi:hypothetical protein
MEQGEKMRASSTAGQEGIRGEVGGRGELKLVKMVTLEVCCPTIDLIAFAWARAVAYIIRNNLAAINPMYHNLRSLSHEQHVKWPDSA